MDFRYCYENGYKEKRKSLFEDEKAYIHGFERAYDVIESFMANADDGAISQISPTIAKINREIREKVIGDSRDWLRVEWYKLVVGFIGGAGEEDNSGKLLQTWKLPEPLSAEIVEDFEEL